MPLGAEGRVGVVADSWILIARAFAPCYIGGWSACEHWELTEQIFREVVVITSKPVRPRRGEIGNVRYLARVVAPWATIDSFLVQRLGIEAPDLVADCRAARSAGYARLDPSGPARGRLVRRWSLQVNVEVPSGP